MSTSPNIRQPRIQRKHEGLLAGAEAIFPPGTVIAEAATSLLNTLNKRLGHTSEDAE